MINGIFYYCVITIPTLSLPPIPILVPAGEKINFHQEQQVLRLSALPHQQRLPDTGSER